MKIKLNLLPKKKKKENLYQKTFLIVIDQIIHIFIVWVVFVLILFGLYVVKKYELNLVSDSIENQKQHIDAKELSEIYSLFNKTNEKIDYIYNLENSRISWLYLFEEISKILDKNIAVKSISVDSNGKLKITAIARTRSDIIKFRDKISNIKKGDNLCLNDVFIPAGDLVKSEIVEFNLSAVVDKKCIIVNNSDK